MVSRLIIVGVPVTWAFGAVFASLLLGPPVAAGSGLALAGIERAAVLAAAVPGGQLRGTPDARFAAVWALARRTI